MLEVFYNDLFKIYELPENSMNKLALKSIVYTMKQNNYATTNKQKLVLNKEIFEMLLYYYLNLFEYFDIFYNLKSDLTSLFSYLLDNLTNNNELNFEAFFCPGYTKYGYKDRLGRTTIWKLEELDKLKKTLQSLKISNQINCYYCDSFIENYDDNLCPTWRQELDFNHQLFIDEALKYFESKNISQTSSLPIFNDEKSIPGYISKEIIDKIPPKIYRAFKLSNENFYKSLNFTEEQIQFRNDKLITMYLMISQYINTNIKNGIYLPMENMYDREKIISTNGTCTLYLKQRRK